MNFTYTDNYEDYRDLLDVRAVDCICKHVCSLESEKAKQVLEVSKKVGYERVMWGYGEGLYTDFELNRQVQLSRIQRFIYNGYRPAVRLILGASGVLWVDNLHSCIANIICGGDDLMLSEMPVYIIDMSEPVPIVVDVESSVKLSYKTIAGALRCANMRISRIHMDLYDINYTIGEFMKENRLDRKNMTLTDEYFDRYLSK